MMLPELLSNFLHVQNFLHNIVVPITRRSCHPHPHRRHPSGPAPSDTMSCSQTPAAETAIPIVLLRIDDESDFILPRATWDAYVPGFKYDGRKDGMGQVIEHTEAKLAAFCQDNGFASESIGVIDFTQTRTQSELDALPEWGNF